MPPLDARLQGAPPSYHPRPLPRARRSGGRAGTPQEQAGAPGGLRLVDHLEGVPGPHVQGARQDVELLPPGGAPGRPPVQPTALLVALLPPSLGAPPAGEQRVDPDGHGVAHTLSQGADGP